MRGGGIVFGPLPRDYSYKLPKKAKWAALSSALSAKFTDGEIMVMDEINIAEPKTKAAIELLSGLGLKDNVLFVVPDKHNDLELAVRNIPRVNVARVKELNVYTVLSHAKIVVSKDAVERMKEAYLG
jgi:large subunit ribosomal protein L4